MVLERGWTSAALASLALASAGCDQVFGLDRAGDASIEHPACTPGERLVIHGAWSSSATSDGSIFVGYKTSDGKLAIQIANRSATGTGIPVMVAGSGETLRLSSAGTGPVVVSFNSSAATGWDQVYTTTITSLGLEAAAVARTPTGWHSTRAAGILGNDRILLSYRGEVPAVPSYDLIVGLYDAGMGAISSQTLDLALGVPVALGLTSSGYLLLTDKSVVALNDTGALAGSTTVAGYEQVALVTGALTDVPSVARASGGAIDLVEFDILARPRQGRLIASGRATIDHLHARATANQTRVLWSEGARSFLVRIDRAGVASTILEIPVIGVNVFSTGLAETPAGPLGFFERDASDGTREVVAVQICEP